MVARGPVIDVRPAAAADELFIREILGASWGGSFIAVHGELIDAAVLPALVAWRSGTRVGLLCYWAAADRRSWEIVSLDASPPGHGAGTALLAAARDLAR